MIEHVLSERPEECPACGAEPNLMHDDQGPDRAVFRCGCAYRCANGTWHHSHKCPNAYQAAVQLRSEKLGACL